MAINTTIQKAFKIADQINTVAIVHTPDMGWLMVTHYTEYHHYYCYILGVKANGESVQISGITTDFPAIIITPEEEAQYFS